jgi:hypothetical protein
MPQAAPVFKPGSKRRPGRFRLMPKPHDPAYNRDQDQKPDEPRMAQEPKGSKGSARSAKIATDPASGEHRNRAPAPNQAEAEQTDGVRKP